MKYVFSFALPRVLSIVMGRNVFLRHLFPDGRLLRPAEYISSMIDDVVIAEWPL